MYDTVTYNLRDSSVDIEQPSEQYSLMEIV